MAAVEDRHRLEVAERQLVLVQSFIPRIDGKVSALFATVSAQLAVAALNISATDLPRWYVTIPLSFFLITVAMVFINLYRCAYPHLDGGHNSMVYFAEIAKRREAEYIKEYTAVSVANLTNDIVGQIWRNSEIVSCKFKYLKTATQFAMFSIVPWMILLLATSYTNGRIPVVGG